MIAFSEDFFREYEAYHKASFKIEHLKDSDTGNMQGDHHAIYYAEGTDDILSAEKLSDGLSKKS